MMTTLSWQRVRLVTMDRGVWRRVCAACDPATHAQTCVSVRRRTRDQTVIKVGRCTGAFGSQAFLSGIYGMALQRGEKHNTNTVRINSSLTFKILLPPSVFWGTVGTKLLEEVRMPKRCYVQLCDWRMPLSARICGKASFSAPRSCCQISLKLFMYYSVCISIEFFFVTATFYSSQQPYFTLKKKSITSSVFPSSILSNGCTSD